MSEAAAEGALRPGGRAAGTDASAGAFLHQAREQAGVHIGALAVALKVPVSKLEALEADRLDLLPDAVFARALAASVCRTLKIDPAQVLRRLPDQVTPRLKIDARVHNATFSSPHMGWHLPMLSRLSRPAAIAVAILLAAALAVFLIPSFDLSKVAWGPSRGLAVPDHGDGSRTVAAVAPDVGAPVAVRSDMPTAPAMAAPTVAPGPPPVASTVTATPAPGIAAAGVTPADRTAAAAKAPALESGLVAFKARATSWVEVTDASGVVQLRKTMAPGETAGVSGTPPLSVVVGRVDSIDVQVRGKAFDLFRVSKDNVARFQIQ